MWADAFTDPDRGRDPKLAFQVFTILGGLLVLFALGDFLAALWRFMRNKFKER
jgi:hypothetical protein